MNEYKITTTIGDLFVTASSRKHAATVVRQDPRFDGAQIKKIGNHKARRSGMKTVYKAGKLKSMNDRKIVYQPDGIQTEIEVNDGR